MPTYTVLVYTAITLLLFCVTAQRCANCHTAFAGDSRLCPICTAKLRPCDRCCASLLPYRFARGLTTCKRCVRLLSTPVQRRAMSVVETEIPTHDFDVDLGIYLDNNKDRIIEILQQALDEHR
jgi:hypothetical protein